MWSILPFLSGCCSETEVSEQLYYSITMSVRNPTPKGLNLTHRIMRGTPGKPVGYVTSSALSILSSLRDARHSAPVSALPAIPGNPPLLLSCTASLAHSWFCSPCNTAVFTPLFPKGGNRAGGAQAAPHRSCSVSLPR
jgi:hypothetical protein